MKSLAISLSGSGSGLRGRDGKGDLTDMQCKAAGNWRNESPHRMNECMLINKQKEVPCKKGKKFRNEPKHEDLYLMKSASKSVEEWWNI
jgi:hypothetical protein